MVSLSTFGRLLRETPGAAASSPPSLWMVFCAHCLPGDSEAVLSDSFKVFVYMHDWP